MPGFSEMHLPWSLPDAVFLHQSDGPSSVISDNALWRSIQPDIQQVSDADLHYPAEEVTDIQILKSSYDMVHDYLLLPDHRSIHQYIPENDRSRSAHGQVLPMLR